MNRAVKNDMRRMTGSKHAARNDRLKRLVQKDWFKTTGSKRAAIQPTQNTLSKVIGSNALRNNLLGITGSELPARTRSQQALPVWRSSPTGHPNPSPSSLPFFPQRPSPTTSPPLQVPSIPPPPPPLPSIPSPRYPTSPTSSITSTLSSLPYPPTFRPSLPCH